MTALNKQALREEFQFMQDNYSDPADHDRQVIYIAAEALLDELEAKDSTIAAPQQEVKSALEHGMQRYAGAMQKLSEGDK